MPMRAHCGRHLQKEHTYSAKHTKLRKGQKAKSSMVEQRAIFELILPRPPQKAYVSSTSRHANLEPAIRCFVSIWSRALARRL